VWFSYMGDDIVLWLAVKFRGFTEKAKAGNGRAIRGGLYTIFQKQADKSMDLL
jgi:hypothetical protein